MGRLCKNVVAEEESLSKKRTVLSDNLQSRIKLLLLSQLGSLGNLTTVLVLLYYFQRALNCPIISPHVLGKEVGTDFITAKLRGREKVAINKIG